MSTIATSAGGTGVHVLYPRAQARDLPPTGTEQVGPVLVESV